MLFDVLMMRLLKRLPTVINLIYALTKKTIDTKQDVLNAGKAFIFVAKNKYEIWIFALYASSGCLLCANRCVSRLFIYP